MLKLWIKAAESITEINLQFLQFWIYIQPLNQLSSFTVLKIFNSYVIRRKKENEWNWVGILKNQIEWTPEVTQIERGFK